MIVSDARVPAFAMANLNKRIVPPFTCLGIERKGEVIGAVVFNNYERTDVHVTVAGSGWTRGFLRVVGKYVFGTLGCLRATIVTEQDKVIDLAQRLGGQTEGTLRNHFGPGRHGIVVGILREDYRFG